MTHEIRQLIHDKALNLRNALRYPSARQYGILALVLLAGCTLVFAARAYNRSTPMVPAQPETFAQPTPVAAQSKPIPLGSELVTIQPFGFEPKEITRPAGPFLLIVDNRSGLRDVTLLLDRTGGNRLVAEPVLWHKLDWRETLDLAPGTYRLSEVANPSWLCEITITEH